MPEATENIETQYNSFKQKSVATLWLPTLLRENIFILSIELVGVTNSVCKIEIRSEINCSV
jgi:hypothetical protein